jgi:hypothetical protein
VHITDIITQQEGALAVTLTLHGAQNSPMLFMEHFESMKKRSGLGDILTLNYSNNLGRGQSTYAQVIHEVAEIKHLILKLSKYYENIYLDGVSCGAKFFAAALLSLCKDGYHTLLREKITFNCINGVIQPFDVKVNFRVAEKLPYHIGWLMTPVLKMAHAIGWRKEAKLYKLKGNGYIRQLNRDASRLIRWHLLKEQVLMMSMPMISSEKARLKGLTLVVSTKDEIVDNATLAKSLSGLFSGKREQYVEVSTKHSTLAYEAQNWRERFYQV